MGLTQTIPLPDQVRRMQAALPVPPVGSLSMGAGPMPAMPAPTAPNVVAGPVPSSPGPPEAQVLRDETRLNDLRSSGDGISQLHNPFLRGLARTADIVGTVLTPGLAQALPGTNLHHQLLVHQQQQKLASDQEMQKQQVAVAQQQAQTEDTQARTRYTNAQADALETPDAPKYDYMDTPSGKVAVRQGTTTAVPLTGPDGKPVAAKGDWQHIVTDGGVVAFNPATAESHLLTDPAGHPLASPQKLTASPPTLGRDGKPHTYMLDAKGNKVQDLGVHYERPVTVNVSQQPLNLGGADSQQAIDAVGSGALKLADVFGRGTTSAQKIAFAAAVKQKYPQFNSGDHDLENGVRKFFTTGQGATSLNAMQTVTHHLDLYDQAADALHNGDTRALNTIGNELGLQMGNDAASNLALIRDGVAMEAARAYTGGVPGEREIENFRSNLPTKGSPQQMHGGANTVRSMLKGKMDALQSQAEAGAQGKSNFGAQTPSAGGGLSVTAPNGKTYHFSDQAAADRFKHAAGIQ